MATDVSNADKAQYWVELQYHAGDPRDWQQKKRQRKEKLPELSLMVHNWKEVDGGALKATLTLYDIDSNEKPKGGQAGKDEPFAKLSVELKKKDGKIVALVPKKGELAGTKEEKEKYEPFFVREASLADFAVRVGNRQLFYRIGRADLHDELADGTFEVGFTLEEGDRVYKSLPPAFSPSFVTLSDPIEDMLALPDRFSDPGRKPSFKTADAAKKHGPDTLAALSAASGPKADVDIDGLRVDKLLDGSVTRRALIETMLKAGGPAMTCKTRELMKDDKDPKLGKLPVLDTEWTSGDIVKGYFTVHDYGILTNNRTEMHYRASKESIRWRSTGSTTHVHGFLNWTGIYAPSWNFWQARYGTKASFGAGRPAWGPFTIEIETCPIPFYRAGPLDLEALKKDKKLDALDQLKLELKRTDPSEQPEDWLPLVLKKGAGDSKASKDYELASMQWAYPIGWGDRRKIAGRVKSKGKQVGFFIGAAPKTLIDGLVDLYLLASLKAGHLLTVTAHVEVDRTVHGHGDPSGIDFQVFYDAITNRISKKGNNKLAGLGGLDIPLGVRYGIHPLRIADEPVSWRGIPLSRLHPGSVKFPTEFPQQSSPPKLK